MSCWDLVSKRGLTTTTLPQPLAGQDPLLARGRVRGIASPRRDEMKGTEREEEVERGNRPGEASPGPTPGCGVRPLLSSLFLHAGNPCANKFETPPYTARSLQRFTHGNSAELGGQWVGFGHPFYKRSHSNVGACSMLVLVGRDREQSNNRCAFTVTMLCLFCLLSFLSPTGVTHHTIARDRRMVTTRSTASEQESLAVTQWPMGIVCASS